MRVLVIGGTVFLGRAVVDEALAAGHDVTVFNRGKSGHAADGVRQITGDRTVADDLEQLRGERFDLVVDTCGFVPADVAVGAEVLAPTSNHYVFVSSINAYPAWPEQLDYLARGAHDADAHASKDDVPAGISAAESYGWLKVGCERAVAQAFGAERTTVLRAGAIVGPSDGAVGRLPWWLQRAARGGEILVPGPPDAPVALIDARDLARFALRAVPGTFDTPGPSARDTRADLMAGCLSATGTDARLTYVTDEAWLVGQDVQAWTELPLWIPDADGPATFRSDASAAVQAGLTWRPLRETLADTWAWQRAIDGGWTPSTSTPGLAADREQELLRAWQATPERDAQEGGSAS
jgi:2'-hydroxyisoflavone reductase